MKKALFITSVLAVWVSLASAQSGIFEKESVDDKKAPLRVTSERMVTNNKKNMISFFGDVVAIKGRLKVESDEMYVFTTDDQSDFKEIEAIGSVRITREGKVATGKKANYYASKQQIILKGDPVLTQGVNVASGETVIYYFETENMEIYGDTKKRSTLVLYPKDEEEDTKTPVKQPLPKKTVIAEDPPQKIVEPEVAPKVEKSKKKEAPKEKKRAKPVKATKPETVEKPKFKRKVKIWTTIQVGSYKDLEEALKLKRELGKKGYNSYIRRFSVDGEDWYRVRIGGFKTRSSAKGVAGRLEKEENLPTLLIPYQP